MNKRSTIIWTFNPCNLRMMAWTGDTWVYDAEDGGADDKWKRRPEVDER